MLVFASPTIDIIEDIDRIVSSFAITIPVRVPGNPILDKLSVRTMFSFQMGVASVKIALGNGAPYALSMISGTSFCLARSASRVISSSVRTFPVGFVGRETQMAAMSSLISKESKSTRYLN